MMHIKEPLLLIDKSSLCGISGFHWLIIVIAHGAMGRRIDPSWGGPIELFRVPASAP